LLVERARRNSARPTRAVTEPPNRPLVGVPSALVEEESRKERIGRAPTSAYVLPERAP